MIKHSLLTLLFVCAAANAQSPAISLMSRTMAVTPDPEHGKVLFLKHCTGCHGRNAWGNGLKEVPSLAGQREFYLVQQLAQFATLERTGSAMHTALKPPDIANPQALRDLAAFLSHAPRIPKPEHGDGTALAAGERAFQHGCVTCHGKSAEGSTTEPIPALAGQHYQYTLVQLRNFAAGHRGQVEPPVIDFTAGLSSVEQQGIADYLSRIKPSESGAKPSESAGPRS